MVYEIEFEKGRPVGQPFDAENDNLSACVAFCPEWSGPNVTTAATAVAGGSNAVEIGPIHVGLPWLLPMAQ